MARHTDCVHSRNNSQTNVFPKVVATVALLSMIET